LLPIVKQLETATVVPVDRWKIRTLTLSGEEKSVVMNNYFSIGNPIIIYFYLKFAGTDAGICLDFHLLRNDKPDLFKSRTINKMWYTIFGGMSTMRGGVALCDQILLAIDGKVVDLPRDVTGIIVLNLASYSAGADLWGPITRDDIHNGVI
jgi:diacylglycerol kinase (ATP)